jgi:hypothetical protein
MLFRALFWIAVVAVLMPREPDLGFGRPGRLGLLAGADPAHLDCHDYETACERAAGFVDSFQAVALRSLAQVKADIEKDQRTFRRTRD